MIAKADTNTGANLVLMDIGNSHVSLATYSLGRREEAQRMAGPTSAEAIVPLLKSMWDQLPLDISRAVVISSVCPPILADVRAKCATIGIEPLLVVGEDIGPPIDADLSEPEKVGTDRLCVAAAAYMQVQSCCTVADFGTALTIDLIADNGVFLGGTIMPGIALCAQSLHEHTALLPLVAVDPSTEMLGKDTQNAIRNGIWAMMIGALREVTESYATQIGKWPTLILTGGDAQAVAEKCDFVDRVIPDLCLDGLVIAFDRHVRQNKNL